MKKLFLLPLGILALLMFSCGHDAKEHEHASHELSLNEGKKWQADDATAAHVEGMKLVTERFHSRQDESLEAYVATGNELSDSIQQLISSCRMKGPDHDALHLWLEPFMTTVKELKNAQSLDAAKASMKEVEDRLSAFNTYFE
jgi:hypothetical protein